MSASPKKLSIREAKLRLLSQSDTVKVIAADESVHDLLGYSAADFVSDRVNFAALIHQEDSDIVELLFSSAAVNAEGDFNFRLRQANSRILCIKGHYLRELSSLGIVVDLLLQDARSLPRTMEDVSNTSTIVAILENTDDYIYFKDSNHVFVGASQSLVSLCEPAEHWTDLLGKTDYDVFPEDLADIYYRLEKYVFHNLVEIHEIQKMETKEGVKGWVDNRKYPIFNANGALIGLYGIARDITEQVKLEHTRAHVTELLERTGALAKVGGWQVDLETMKLTWTKETFRIAEIEPPIEPDLANGIHLFAPEVRPVISEAIEKLIEANIPYDLELPLITAKGNRTWVRTQGYGEVLDNKVVRIYGTFQDISSRKESELALIESKNSLKEAQRIAHMGNWTFDSLTNSVTWSDEMYRIFGMDLQQPAPTFTEQERLFSLESWGRLSAAVQASLTKGENYELELETKRPDGRIGYIWVRGEVMRNAEGAVTGIQGIALDLTERKQTESTIDKLSNFDSLTGLMNRARSVSIITSAIDAHRAPNKFGGLLMVDINSLRTLNDTLGHDAGDALLIEVSKRLQNCVRPGDLVSRFAGDVFVLLMPNIGGTFESASKELQALALTVLGALEGAYLFEKGSFYTSCSAGATLIKGDEESAMVLLKQVDIALTDAKLAGRNSIRFFDPELQVEMNNRVELLNDLRRGIAENQFEMFYQPQLDKYNQIVSAEALLRWHHPSKGLLSPSAFVPAVEEHGLMRELGSKITKMCLAQLERWHTNLDFRHLQLSINISVEQFKEAGFDDDFQQLLAEYEVDASSVTLEITESMLMADVEKAQATVDRLNSLGIRFAIDDFGTGYSSLSYLGQLPIDQLKIDQSFVGKIGCEGKSDAIVKSIIELAKILGMEVLAEGVETAAQRKFLLQHGCEYFQGFLFSEPLPLAEFEALVMRDRSAGH